MAEVTQSGSWESTPDPSVPRASEAPCGSTTRPLWSIAGGLYKVVQETTPRLPAGIYACMVDNNGTPCLSQAMPKHDDMFDLPGLPIKYILDQVEQFWSKKAEYERFGFIQKRGIMLYGPPGCGKTSAVNLLMKQVVSRDGVVLLSGNGFTLLMNVLDALRKVEPERPVMTVTEDLESHLESGNSVVERAALALYDGERQVNNIVHLATTNKPDLLSDRFIRRPGRFDLVIGIFQPTAETRRAYLKTICNGHLPEDKLEEIVERTEGLSLAYLREIVSTYLILEIPLDDTIARLKDLDTRKYPVKSRRTGYTIGFAEEASWTKARPNGAPAGVPATGQ